MQMRSEKTNGTSIYQMLCCYLKNNAHRFLLLATLLLAIAMMWQASPMGYDPINNEETATFEHAWQYSLNGEAFSTIVLPQSMATFAGARITLKNVLPTEVIKGATILLRTSQQSVGIFVNEENIYNSRKYNSSSTAAYHFVRLPTDCAGKEITVVLDSEYKNYAGNMNQIYIGSKASNIFFLLNENGFRTLIGFLISCLGVLLMTMFLFIKAKSNKSSLIYLGAFFLCAGYWVMVESRMLQFIFPYPISLTNSSIFALTLLPVFSGLYYYTQTKLFRTAWKTVITLVTMASFLFAVMSCFNPSLPLHILPYYLVIIGLYLIAIFTSIITEGVKERKVFSTSVFGAIAFAVCSMFELVFYLMDMNSFNNSNFLTLGLLLFCIAMVIDSIQNLTQVYQAAIKVDTLSILAYTDSLTGLRNRTAFLESMSKVDIGEEALVSLAMFDINNLKDVNDTFGHLLGDVMLMHSAKAIKNSLRHNDELYRIGGDEFAAIIHHDNTLNLGELETHLINILDKENQAQLNYLLSIAYGYATFTSETDKTLFETLARADESMYIRKKIQKSNEITH